MGPIDASLTVDQLAHRAGTPSRNIRAFQTLGLLHRPRLRGRIGLYDQEHLTRLEAILRLQRSGFSLAALRSLFAACEQGMTLEQVLGVPARTGRRRPPGEDSSDRASDDLGPTDQLRAFDDWPVPGPATALAVVPTTVLELVAS